MNESIRSAKRFSDLDIESLGTLFLTDNQNRNYVMYDVNYSPNLVANFLSIRKLR